MHATRLGSLCARPASRRRLSKTMSARHPTGKALGKVVRTRPLGSERERIVSRHGVSAFAGSGRTVLGVCTDRGNARPLPIHGVGTRFRQAAAAIGRRTLARRPVGCRALSVVVDAGFRAHQDPDGKSQGFEHGRRSAGRDPRAASGVARRVGNERKQRKGRLVPGGACRTWMLNLAGPCWKPWKRPSSSPARTMPR